MGIGGAVLTLRVARELVPLALAELALALIGAVFIVASGHAWRQAGAKAEAPNDTQEPAAPAAPDEKAG
jgi:hypothetical protein